MNEYIYYTLIVPFIDKKDRVITKRCDRHLLIFKNHPKLLINSSIYVHQGSPCYKYCICKYFNNQELITIYKGKQGSSS